MGIKGFLTVVAAGWAAGGGWAHAQSAPAYPASMERAALLLWLQRETDIMPDRVVAVTPQAVTAVVSTFPGGGGQPPRLVIRAEALSPEAYEQTEALSWHVSVSADCEGRRIRLGETTGYRQRNLLGERRQLRPAEVNWRAPQPGTALDLAWRAACEPKFQGPLHGEALNMARPDPAAPQEAPSSDAGEPPPPPPPPPEAGATPPRRPPAATAKSRPAGPVVQVGAASSEGEARRILEALPADLNDREGWVETATVGGRVWRRAVVGGFADRTEAAGFCTALKRAGGDCFVRD